MTLLAHLDGRPVVTCVSIARSALLSAQEYNQSEGLNVIRVTVRRGCSGKRVL